MCGWCCGECSEANWGLVNVGAAHAYHAGWSRELITASTFNIFEGKRETAYCMLERTGSSDHAVVA